MTPMAEIFLFTAVMGILSIPIIAVLKWKPKNKNYEKRIAELEEKVSKLELRSLEQHTDINSIASEVKYTSRLLEKN